MVGSAAKEVSAHIVEEDQNFVFLEENGQCIRLDSIVSISEVEVKEHINPFSFLKSEPKQQESRMQEVNLSAEEKARANAIAKALDDFQRKVIPEEPVHRAPHERAQFTLSATISKNFTAIRSEENIRKEEERRQRELEKEAKRIEEMKKKEPHIPTTVQLTTVGAGSFHFIRSPENEAKVQERERIESLRQMVLVEKEAQRQKNKVAQEERKPRVLQLKTFKLSNFGNTTKVEEQLDVVAANDPQEPEHHFNNVAICNSIAI